MSEKLPSHHLAQEDADEARLDAMRWGHDNYERKVNDLARLDALGREVTENPDMKLTDDEVRFLYELDDVIEGPDNERSGYARTRISEIRGMRHGQDKEQLARLVPESIYGQVQNAYETYFATVGRLAESAGMPEEALTVHGFEKLFAAKDEEWRTNGTYDYIVESLSNGGDSYDLLATPNVDTSAAQIVGLAKDFGKLTLVQDEAYLGGHYSDQELSGYTGNAPVRFGLIPKLSDSEFMRVSDPAESEDEVDNWDMDDWEEDERGHTELQMELLHKRQVEHPAVGMRVPSVLDAVVYWYTLKAAGKMNGPSTWDKTFIRHFNLEEKRLNDNEVVPKTLVQQSGRNDYDGILGTSVDYNHDASRIVLV